MSDRFAVRALMVLAGCAGSTGSRPGAEAGTGDASSMDAGGDANSVTDASSDADDSSDHQACKNDFDCSGVGGTCQGGFCCNGEFGDAGCTCGSGPGCDVTSMCCTVDGGLRCVSQCPVGPGGR